jgi:carboxymethylenebutenolidase
VHPFKLQLLIVSWSEMPAYEPQHVEYNVINGRISVVGDDGVYIPAYWSHPDIGGRFPAVVILHDWWGITDTERHMAHRFAQLGYYVLIPDLFDGAVASTPEEAYRLVETRGKYAYRTVDTALSAIENHMRTDGNTAAVGLGMGGSFAYEAAIKRSNLEVAVAFYGFPQRYFGKFQAAQAPILAIYGSNEPHVSREVIEQLRRELSESRLKHEVMILDGVGRNFLDANPTPGAPEQAGALAWTKMLAFLEANRVIPRNGNL